MYLLSNNELAASIFNGLAEQMTGKRIERTVSGDVPGDLIVIGSDSDNCFVAEKVLDGSWVLPPYRSGSDDFFIRTFEEQGRRVLLLGGGRPRAFLYAVYAYFEAIGCSYFWDGDVIPERETLPLENFDTLEVPRFEYRGLRYFAHRSLHRFQAEHWTLDDWKKEIDWILKKRLNLFMLRIGQDDLFQKAFPDIVPYPQDNVPPRKEFDRSYDDRTHFWSLQERGKLRKSLLEYAFERDLLHPEDTGTMSHWYSRTPQEFLETVKPDFVPQASQVYGDPTGLVWDIRKDRELDNYFKLTQTHIDNFGSGAIFHTIGLAERSISSDKAVNHRWKLYAYRRIQERLRKSYPDAPLLIASWDFLNGSWTSDEMQELMDTFDPAKTLLFDYTSDTCKEDNNFTHWHCVGKFPWIFGIFQAFASGTDLRGNYSTIRKRLTIAREDPFCKGMVIWPENSHADTLMYEYFAANAWKAELPDIRDFLPVFCRKRYGAYADVMESVWSGFLPVIESGYWNYPQFYGEVFARFCLGAGWGGKIEFPASENQISISQDVIKRLMPGILTAADGLQMLAECRLDDTFVRRDVIDLARTAGGRIIQYLYNQAFLHYPDKAKMSRLIERMREALYLLADIVRSSPEFSLCDSLDRLKQYLPVNPVFEHTLKGNAENSYCRTYIAELFDGCYFREFELYARYALTGEKNQEEWNSVTEEFYKTPLEQYRPDCGKYLAMLPESIKKLSILARQLCNREQ